LPVFAVRRTVLPTMAGSPPNLLRFGVFELDVGAGELRKSGSLVHLQGQPLALLALLAGRAGQVVSREEIQAAVWGPDVHVDFEQGINACIRQVRAALDDQAESPRFVQTLPRRGYRFVAPVEAPSIATRQEQSRLIWALGLGVAVLAVLAVLAAARPGPSRTGTPAHPPVLVVLPFVDLTPDGSGDLLADGMTEELIAQVGRRFGPRLPVIARTTAMTFKGRRVDVAELGRTLDADVALEGSVRRDGARVRVTAQLVRTADREHLWAAHYDRSTPGLIALQAEVADGIARALGLRLLPGQELPGMAATSEEAYGVTLAARAALTGDPPDPARARAGFERALALDPAFAPAWLGYGQACLASAPNGEGAGRAREAFRKALALDDGLAAAHLALANLQLYVDWDLEGAGREFRRALELEPASAEVHHDMAAWWSVQGEHGEAIASVRRALRLDPLSPAVLSDVGWYAYFARRYDEAVEGSRRTLEVAPRDYWARRCLLLVASLRHDPAGVRAMARQIAVEAKEEGAALLPELGPDADAAARAFWRWDLERKERRAALGRVPFTEVAANWMVLGERDRALKALETATRRRTGWSLAFLGVDPLYDGLRSDPRFRELLEGIGMTRARISAGAPPSSSSRGRRRRPRSPRRRSGPSPGGRPRSDACPARGGPVRRWRARSRCAGRDRPAPAGSWGRTPSGS